MKQHCGTASHWSFQTGTLRMFLTGLAGLFLLTTGCLVDQSLRVKTATPSLALSESQVALVGSIHKMHLMDEDYPMQVLGALIEDWNPDLVLVALPPKALAQGAWEQGPIEMSYVTWVARHAHIAVEGIGWHSPAGCRAKAARMTAKMPAMIAQMKGTKASGKSMSMKAMMRSKMISMLPRDAVGPARGLMRLMPPSFETAHSPAFERLQRILLNAMARTKPKMMLQALVKEAQMAHLAAEAIRRHHAKRVLVVVGLRHRLGLADYLAGLGARLVNPSAILAARGLEARAFLNRPISQQVIAMWREAIGHIEAKLRQALGPMRLMLTMKKQCFEWAIAQNGRCCLTQDQRDLAMKALSALLRSTTSPTRSRPTGAPASAGASQRRTPAETQGTKPADAAGIPEPGNDTGAQTGDGTSKPGAAARPRPATRPQPAARPRPAARPQPDDAQGDPAGDAQTPQGN